MPRHMRLPTVMKHRFSEVPDVRTPRSTFDRSYGNKFTFDAGFLVPFYVDEVVPGDTFKLSSSIFARMATPLKPLMDNLFLETFFFAVPNRLLWDNWEKFNGAQDDPGDSTDFTMPILTNGTVATGSLADYMGLPVNLNMDNHTIRADFFRAYNMIWNEWFRDQNLQDSVQQLTGDGPQQYSNFTLLRRGKRHDYFTSCLPWPQKGDSVSIPLGTEATIFTDSPEGSPVSVFTTAEGASGEQRLLDPDTVAGRVEVSSTLDASSTAPLRADLTNATAATINQLRQAFQVQKLLEKDARGGTRYTEVIRGHFGVTSPDARMQRPEYLGGGRAAINISPIPQTSEDGTTPQGNLAAYGTASASGHGFTRSFTEHCVLIGLVCVRADLNYQQGVERMWSRSTRYDFYWPSLAHIGEQAVESREIWVDNTTADDDVFGYQERYAEYRYKPSNIAGLFRSDAVGTLDIWHLAQDFATRPLLDDTFIQENPPIARVIATPTEPHFLFDSYTRITAARPMPLYGVPGFIDHF